MGWKFMWVLFWASVPVLHYFCEYLVWRMLSNIHNFYKLFHILLPIKLIVNRKSKIHNFWSLHTHTHTHHVSHICQCKIDNEWGISPGESTFLFFEQINCLLSLLLFHFTVFLRIFHLFSSSLSVSQFLCLFPSSSLVYSHIFTILTIPSRNQTNKQTISHTKINNYLYNTLSINIFTLQSLTCKKMYSILSFSSSCM